MRLCPYCHAPLYALADGMRKCSRCKKKVSPKKAAKVLNLITAFCQHATASETARQLGLSYVSVQRYFNDFRHLCAQICDDEYEARRHIACDYEEYHYLERAKRHRKNAVFDAQNFLTFDYDGHIYTIVMPSLHQYRQQFIDDALEPLYLAEFEKFKRQSRLIKLSSHHNNIVRFWEFFETAIVRYKGIGNERFPLFLKELEFKFNHAQAGQWQLLKEYYYR